MIKWDTDNVTDNDLLKVDVFQGLCCPEEYALLPTEF